MVLADSTVKICLASAPTAANLPEFQKECALALQHQGVLLRADPQYISGKTNACLLWYKSLERHFDPLADYNRIMSFVGVECGITPLVKG